MPVTVSIQQLLEAICEYLEAVTHEILYRRAVYSPDIFERERLYGIALHKSRHPELNLYISDSILSIKVSLCLRSCKPGVILKCFYLQIKHT